MAGVFETGKSALKLTVEAGFVGMDCLPEAWDGSDGVGYRLCLFLHKVSLEVFPK